MACGKSQPETFVPVCANVIYEAPGVIYVSVDPDVWKIRCRQCQEKTEHKCALKKLKNKFRGDPSKRRQPKPPPGEGAEDMEEMGVVGKKLRRGRGGGADGGDGDEDDDDSMNLEPPEQIPDDMCACKDRPKDAPRKPYVCLCEIYKPLNFVFELEVTGEFKPAHVPKTKPKKDKE